ncbi:hypothetical protein EKO04_004449 [Ascochyta lentis]|uniref:Uncharacterized protein n=1 Tax=Ascochyta lentis TaxID=205686 RepID=A0A8H7J4J6_9PLEO|nr:hypothetical protein EKO04_004449 [Ascochyta lentis]
MPSATAARTMIRSWARQMTEPHPFARNPVTVKPYPAQYRVMGKKLLRTSAVFFPWYAIVLGWPVAAEWAFNGRM